MRKHSTEATKRKEIFRERQLTIGMDLGDRFTYNCILDEAGEVMAEEKHTTRPWSVTRGHCQVSRGTLASTDGWT